MSAPPSPAGADSADGAAPARGVALPLHIYVCLIFAGSVLAMGTFLVRQFATIPWFSTQMIASYLLASLLIAGELRPVLLTRADGGSDRITVSTTFSLALILTGPIGFALLAQAMAAALDDLICRTGLVKTMFNVGQYILTLATSRWVFCAVSGHEYLAPTTTFLPGDLLAALLTGVVFFLVNNGAVAIAVAVDLRLNLLQVLWADMRVQGLTSTILFSLAPIAATVTQVSPFLLPLLVLPLVGIQRSTWVATQRQHEALHDGLTGLPNRELLRRRATRALLTAHSERQPVVVAVMLLDLDHFKEVNDTLGHHVGDELLREVAIRVTSAVPEDATVARLGGDEFAVLVTVAGDATAATAIAEQIRLRLHEPIVADGVRIGVQASIGISVSTDHEASIDTLLQRADIALYQAKANRGEVQLYRPEIDGHTVMKLSLLADLHYAVEHGEFEMLYQPQIDTATGQVVALEALMRWRHPLHGVISPDVFIPLAESTGLIREMSRAGISMALSVLGSLRREGFDLSVAVNISPRLLSDLEMPTWITELLMDTGVPPQHLTVEVTETTITSDPLRAMQVLQDLRELGARLSIDDFGTGYSSLSYLRQLQPDELKVDKSFVTHMMIDDNCGVILRSTVELGHNLGISVVAEGVEDEETYGILEALGCNVVQGYHVARPMPESALLGWLKGAKRAGWRKAADTDREPAES